MQRACAIKIATGAVWQRAPGEPVHMVRGRGMTSKAPPTTIDAVWVPEQQPSVLCWGCRGSGTAGGAISGTRTRQVLETAAHLLRAARACVGVSSKFQAAMAGAGCYMCWV